MVERRISEVDVVLLRHAILRQAQTFAEPLEVDDLTGTEELDDIVDIRVVAEAEDIVIGNAGLLLCCDFVRTTFRSALTDMCLFARYFMAFSQKLPIWPVFPAICLLY